MLSKKSIILKNGQPVNLEFYEMPEGFSIFAVDKNNEVVGLLSFEIMRQYVCERSEAELEELSVALKMPVSRIEKKLTINVSQAYQNDYEIHGDHIVVDGQKYVLTKSIAYLNLIEIKNKDFFQVGLGSAMHQELENFASENGCDEIRLSLYYPFGEFKNGTRSFYEHAGYVFDQTEGVISVYKPLSRILNNGTNMNASSGTQLNAIFGDTTGTSFRAPYSTAKGTPINKKYLKEKF